MMKEQDIEFIKDITVTLKSGETAHEMSLQKFIEDHISPSIELDGQIIVELAELECLFPEMSEKDGYFGSVNCGGLDLEFKLSHYLTDAMQHLRDDTRSGNILDVGDVLKVRSTLQIYGKMLEDLLIKNRRAASESFRWDCYGDDEEDG